MWELVGFIIWFYSFVTDILWLRKETNREKFNKEIFGVTVIVFILSNLFYLYWLRLSFFTVGFLNWAVVSYVDFMDSYIKKHMKNRR